MVKSKVTEPRPTSTTTLIVTKPTDFSLLEAHYQLIRYILPKDLRYRAKHDKNTYGRMHNCLRDQLNCPYKTFMYDTIDGSQKWVVYALYSRPVKPGTLIDVKLPFVSDIALEKREISFRELELHNLLKLLQIAYIRGDQTNRFVGQDYCYVYAKKDTKEDDALVCLRIDLNGDIRNQKEDIEQELKITGRACLFKKVNYPSDTLPPFPYFGNKPTQDKRYLIHLKRDEIENHKKNNLPLYGIRTRADKRTTLDYHDQYHIDASRGKLLFDFINDFRSFLTQFDISCRIKERQFMMFDPLSEDQASLPLCLLDPIKVFDNRLNKTHSLQNYLEIFDQIFDEQSVHFVDIEDLSMALNEPALILQDHNKEDFLEGGILFGQVDPYKQVYDTYAHIAKQSFNINQNKGVHSNLDMYLHYDLPSANNKSFRVKLEAALEQLYLKNVVLNELSVQAYLPHMPINQIFIRKMRTIANQAPYETLLYVENDRLRFVDLRDPAQKILRDKLLGQLGIDWCEQEEHMLHKYRKSKQDNGENESALAKEDQSGMPHYNCIVGPGFFAELEELEERVLYNYKEIIRRQTEVKTALPIESFKLLPHYDKLRNKPYLSFEQLEAQGLLEGKVLPKKNSNQEKSLNFYRQLEAYDEYLDELLVEKDEISFNELWDGDQKERIISIFGFKPDKNNKYTSLLFKGYYQSLGWFTSDKAEDVHMYRGIWYDNKQCYMVGAPQRLKDRQPRAHLIRCFDVYQGEDNFDIRPLLLTTSVQFVRHDQYTVYPYPFHLIDVYVESFLQYQEEGID
ncbi:hypothetical protein [Dictyobacter kobayashii]|uniref:Uncharacterized protein n=1 Tax=Dictyobacter kobayashii TaxID=2014872 RepID=A0A402AP22_9CHLR|nr:hypothetical protein [Dictyobacter kobayashii]GCE20913.1 hypothetical protein KDK_47130 [Dictyobacter kobayashii]